MFASHKFVMLQGARKHTYLIRVSAMTYYKILNSAKNTKHKTYKVSLYLFFFTTFLYLHYNDIKRHAKRTFLEILLFIEHITVSVYFVVKTSSYTAKQICVLAMTLTNRKKQRMLMKEGQLTSNATGIAFMSAFICKYRTPYIKQVT